MRIPLVCLSAALSATAPALAWGATLHGPPATVRAVLAADLAFERNSEQHGAAVAFGAAMDAADGLEFGAGPPLRGAAAIAAASAKNLAGGTLRWAPQEVFASSGDLGVVWGTWSFTAGKGAPATGRYVTVWRRNAHGAWKGLIDIGTDDK